MSWADVFLKEHRAYIRSEYDADFVYQIKYFIPSAGRRWAQETREWIVEERYWWAAEQLLYEWYDDVSIYGTFEDTATRREEPRGETDKALAALWLLPGAPPELVRTAYRVMAHLAHPDHGGSVEKMKQINLAYEHLRSVGATP